MMYLPEVVTSSLATSQPVQSFNVPHASPSEQQEEMFDDIIANTNPVLE